MSPQQTSQIRLRLDRVAAQRAEQAIKAPPAAVKAFSQALARAATPPPGATVAELIKGVVKASTQGQAGPGSDGPGSDATGNAARCARKRAVKGKAGKEADAARKRAARAKKA